MDHGISTDTPRRWIPLVVGVQIGLFGLAIGALRLRHSDDPPPRETLPARSLDVEWAQAEPPLAPPGDAAAPRDPGPPEPDWLPPLSGPAREVLASFRSLAEEEGLAPTRSQPRELGDGPVKTHWPDTDAWDEPRDDDGMPIARLGPLLAQATATPGPQETRGWQDEAGGECTPLRLQQPVSVHIHAARAAAAEQEPAETASEREDAEPRSGPELLAADSGAPLEAPRPEEEVEQVPAEAACSPRTAFPVIVEDEVEAESEPIPGLVPDARPRSWQLERIAREADAHTRRGFELAGRRALFSARSEFVVALRLIAQGLDTEHRTDIHSEALARGLAALKEAEDFVPTGPGLEAELDLPTIVAGHATPVLKRVRLEDWTPLLALERYFTYAQEQLALAVGREVAGSMALHALGKLHAEASGQATLLGIRAAGPKAMAFYQAALLVDPQNFMASNDLAVLLARSGRYVEARAALIHSLRQSPHVEGWRNLAVVCGRLGQHELAARADAQWQAMVHSSDRHGGPAPDATPPVQWVPPDVLAGSQADATARPPHRQASPAAAPPAGPQRPAGGRKLSSRAWYFTGAESRQARPQ